MAYCSRPPPPRNANCINCLQSISCPSVGGLSYVEPLITSLIEQPLLSCHRACAREKRPSQNSGKKHLEPVIATGKSITRSQVIGSLRIAAANRHKHYRRHPSVRVYQPRLSFHAPRIARPTSSSRLRMRWSVNL